MLLWRLIAALWVGAATASRLASAASAGARERQELIKRPPATPALLGPLQRLRGGTDADVDEGLYSRQLYVMGHEAQRSLASSSVLLVGLSGLGAEIAKNLVLAGIRTLDVTDETSVSLSDLSTSWLHSEADVGSARDAEVVARLGPLNPHVSVRRVHAKKGGFTIGTREDLEGYTVLVAVDRTVQEQMRLNELARAAGCKLVCASSRGAFGSIFCDFGDAFVVNDPDGEEPKQALLELIRRNTPFSPYVAPRFPHVSEIDSLFCKQALLEHVDTEADDAQVLCVEQQPHGLQEGDYVRFSEVEGMEPLCDESRPPVRVSVSSRHALRIGSTRGLGRSSHVPIFPTCHTPLSPYFRISFDLFEFLTQPIFPICHTPFSPHFSI